jgi:hypothetical protein
LGDKAKRVRRRVMIALAILPIIIAILVVGGVFAGFQVARLVGAPHSVIYPLAFSAVGLMISIVVSYLIAKRVSEEK